MNETRKPENAAHVMLFSGEIGGEMILKVFEGFRFGPGGVKIETLNANVYDVDLIDEGAIDHTIYDANRWTLAGVVEDVKRRAAPGPVAYTI